MVRFRRLRPTIAESSQNEPLILALTHPRTYNIGTRCVCEVVPSMSYSARPYASFRLAVTVLAMCLASFLGSSAAQEGKPSNADQIAPEAQSGKEKDKKHQTDQDVDPLKRPLSDKQRKENTKALKQELSKTYKKWLDEDVRWIITDEERGAFKQLSNDEERDQFIEAFWARRDPTPDTGENEFKEEHYRRIAYANEHFPAGIPGWKTDRGRIYIVFGKADEI